MNNIDQDREFLAQLQNELLPVQEINDTISMRIIMRLISFLRSPITLVIGIVIFSIGLPIWALITDNWGYWFLFYWLFFLFYAPDLLDDFAMDRSKYPYLVFCVIAYVVSFVVCILTPILAINTSDEAGSEFIINGLLIWLLNILTFSGIYEIGDRKILYKNRGNVGNWFGFPNYNNTKYDSWLPKRLDYIFLSFTTGTSFSPTDTSVLSGWAKIITMVQSIISLAFFAIVIARGVNLLQNDPTPDIGGATGHDLGMLIHYFVLFKLGIH